MQTKLALVALVDRGALTPNAWAKTLNLPPLPGGDEPIRRLDTAAIAKVDEEDKTDDTGADASATDASKNDGDTGSADNK